VNRPDAVTLRPARIDECWALAEMSRELIEAGLGWRYTPMRMARMMGDKDAVTLVATDGARVLGFAVMLFAEEHAHLALLCVRPEHRRLGIARRLHEWLIETARVAGIASVSLELRADNVAALAFYRSLGFGETLWIPGYYSGQIAARRMTLSLRSVQPETGV
jgi:ribosomal-protein-alanine N-acetyltransferase